MTIVFSNFSSKILNLGIFGPKFKDLYFALNFVIGQIRIPARNYPNKAFFVLNLSKYSLFLHETSHINKLDGIHFENGNRFFKFHRKIPKYEIFFGNSNVPSF